MSYRIALLTIGQSPRVDIVPEIRRSLPEYVEIVEAGVLDDFSVTQIASHMPKTREATLVTRLRDGTEVHIDKQYAHGKLQQLVHALQGQVDLIALLCSATFDSIFSSCPLIIPDRLMYGFLSSVLFPAPLGVLVPVSDQISVVTEEFRAHGLRALGASVSPYAKEDRLATAIRDLTVEGISAIVLNCFGYTLEMKRSAEAISGKGVVCVRSLLIAALVELVGTANR